MSFKKNEGGLIAPRLFHRTSKYINRCIQRTHISAPGTLQDSATVKKAELSLPLRSSWYKGGSGVDNCMDSYITFATVEIIVVDEEVQSNDLYSLG